MRIGYACKTDGIENTNIRSCILKNANEDKLRELIVHNLWALENILQYNIEHHISMFRISSDLIPFGSLHINEIEWWKDYQEDFTRIGKLASTYKLRLSTHPGQYTIINSPNQDVVNRSIADLKYHARILDALGCDASHKMVLHIGGVYGDKNTAMQRFVENFKQLPQEVVKHLVLEHDDRLFHVNDVLQLANQCQIPIIFDNLHNEILPFENSDKNEMEWLMKCRSTWTKKDGVQKIHYANQAYGKRVGAHSNTIDDTRFFSFLRALPIKDIDIMLEVKDKNTSVERILEKMKSENNIQITCPDCKKQDIKNES